jgi:hypothetical protein
MIYNLLQVLKVLTLDQIDVYVCVCVCVCVSNMVVSQHVPHKCSCHLLHAKVKALHHTILRAGNKQRWLRYVEAYLVKVFIFK